MTYNGVSPVRWRRPAAGGPVRGLIFVGLLALIGLASLPACNLIGGGKAEKDAEGAPSELDLTQLELDTAYKEIASLKAEIEGVRAQAQAAETKAKEGLISLERARLDAIIFAQQNLEVYGEYASVPLVWQVESADEGDEFYYIQLTYRPAGNFEGRTGLEEFIMDKTGKIEFRQVLDEPDPQGEPRGKPPEKPKE